MKGLSTGPENGPVVKPDCGAATTLNIKVSHGLNEHEVAVPSNSSFGDLKSIIVQKIGLNPETHKLLFRGKEKDDDEDLQTAGVKDNSKVLLMEDMTCRQTNPEEVKETTVVSRGGEAVAKVREEVNKLSDQISALQAVVNSGTQVDNKDIVYLTEMLMRQLLKLDGIEAEGEGRVQRKMEVRRVQSFVETMDILKSKNSNPLSNGNNNVSVTTQWETFEHKTENASTASPMPSAPTPVPSPAPTLTPVPSSAPTPTPVPFPAPVQSPACSPMPSSAHSPVLSSADSPVLSSAHSPVPSSAHSPVPSLTPSSMPSSTKVMQDWEHFD